MSSERRLEAIVAQALSDLGIADAPIGVACSGGADSVALLHLLVRGGYAPAVFHVDHGLRDDSSADARFVEQLATELALRFVGRRVIVESAAGASLEAAARDARYEALLEAATSAGVKWVATAHTLDDQAETVVLRAIRGGGLEGIAPLRGMFVRPLLSTRRQALRDWLRANRLEWREDPTNTDTRLERNWLRAEIMPALRARRPGVDSVLARVASHARADERMLDGLASDVYARSEIDPAGVLLPRRTIDGLPEALLVRVVRKAVRAMGSDPSWTDLDAVLGLENGKTTTCGRVGVWRLPDGLAFMTATVAPPDDIALKSGVAELPEWGIRARVGSSSVEGWTWRTFVPEDEGLLLRASRAGDRVATKSGTKKVQDVLVDAKVPRPLRDFVPVLAGEHRALAVVGITRSPEQRGRVVDAQPSRPSWSRRPAWTRASS